MCVLGSSTGRSERERGPALASRNNAPQLIVLHEEPVPDEAKIELVQYTGAQTALGGIKSRRRAAANTTAIQSEMGNLLHWAAAPPGVTEHRAPGAVRRTFTRT